MFLTNQTAVVTCLCFLLFISASLPLFAEETDSHMAVITAAWMTDKGEYRVALLTLYSVKSRTTDNRKLLRSRMSTHWPWFRIWSQGFCIVCMSSHSFVKYHSNHSDNALCYINSYFCVCSERRSRADRYDSMVSTAHVFRCCCVFVAVSVSELFFKWNYRNSCFWA